MLFCSVIIKIKRKEKNYKPLIYFFGKISFGEDDFQKVLVYQPTFNILGLKEDKGNEHVIGWKSKGIYDYYYYEYIIFDLDSLQRNSLNYCFFGAMNIVKNRDEKVCI